MIQPDSICFTLDYGNTSFSIAAFRRNKLLKVKAIRKDDLAGLKKFTGQWKSPVDACIVSSVIKSNSALMTFLRKKARVLRVNRELMLPIKNNYETPATLGTDRLACVAGAHKLFPRRNILVIDAGTCIKYDFIDFRGVYNGGSISPGLTMRFEALHHYTSALPLIRPHEFRKLTGQNTKESILTGVQQGIRFEMEGFISSYKRQYKNLLVVMTGGDSSRFVKHLKNNIFAAPHLIHIGLYDILYKNLA